MELPHHGVSSRMHEVATPRLDQIPVRDGVATRVLVDQERVGPHDVPQAVADAVVVVGAAKRKGSGRGAVPRLIVRARGDHDHGLRRHVHSPGLQNAEPELDVEADPAATIHRRAVGAATTVGSAADLSTRSAAASHLSPRGLTARGVAVARALGGLAATNGLATRGLTAWPAAAGKRVRTGQGDHEGRHNDQRRLHDQDLSPLVGGLLNFLSGL